MKNYRQFKDLYKPYYQEIDQKSPLLLQIQHTAEEINKIEQYNEERDAYIVQKPSAHLELDGKTKLRLDGLLEHYFCDELMLEDREFITIKDDPFSYRIVFEYPIPRESLARWQESTQRMYINAEVRQWDFGAYGETQEEVQAKLDKMHEKWLSMDDLKVILRFLKTKLHFGQVELPLIEQRRIAIRHEMKQQMVHIESLEDETMIAEDQINELKHLTLNVAFDTQYHKLAYRLCSRLKDVLFTLEQKREEQGYTMKDIQDEINRRGFQDNVSLQYFIQEEDLYTIENLWMNLCEQNKENPNVAVQTLINLNYEMNQVLVLTAEPFEED